MSGSSDAHIKLLHISTAPEFLFFLRGQADFLRRHGFEVYALSSPGPMLHQFRDTERVAVKAVRLPRQIAALGDLVALCRIWTHLRELRPHIIDAQTPKGGLLGMLAAWIARTPVRVYHVHGLPFATASGP